MSYERGCGTASCFNCDEPCRRLNVRKEKQKEKAETCMRYKTLVSRFLQFNSSKASSNLEKVQRLQNSKTLKSKANFKKILQKCKSESINNAGADADVAATTTPSICDTCYEIVSSFCETYFNWTFLQLLLDQRTKEIAQRMEKVDVRKLDVFRINFLMHAGHKATQYPELKLRKVGDDDDDDNGHKKCDTGKPMYIEILCEQRQRHPENEVDINQKETLYKCFLCGDEFLENEDFLEHLQMHYSENEDKQAEKEEVKKEFQGDHDLEVKEENADELSETEDENFEFETLVPDGMVFNRKSGYMPTWQQEQEAPDAESSESESGTTTGESEKASESGKSEPSLVKEKIARSSVQLQCEFCGKTFARMCHLMNHMRVHRAQKYHQRESSSKKDVKFLCSCGKTFLKMCHFKNHSKMHKPFKRVTRGKPLPGSGTRSSQKPTLQTKRNSYLRCRFCGKEFQQTTAYKVHSMRHMPHFDLELD